MDGRQEKRHSSEVTAARERRSKRTILKRTVILMLLCGVGLFIPLFLRLWDIAIVAPRGLSAPGHGAADPGPVRLRRPGQHL